MRVRLDLRHLRALLGVVEEGGFVRGARAIGVSQSTMSECIQSLERVVGAPVIRRTKRAVLLTPVGEALLPFARQMLALEADALACVAAAANTAPPHVVIGTSESISTYLLPGCLAALSRRSKGQVHIHAATGSEIRVGLKSGRFDLGLVCEAAVRRRAERSEVLGETEMVVFSAREHPLADREARLSSLRANVFRLSDGAGSFQGVIQRCLEVTGSAHVKLAPTGSVEAVKLAVAKDAGSVGVLPLFAVEHELRRGELARIHPIPPLPPVILKALSNPERSSSPLVTELVGLVRARVQSLSSDPEALEREGRR
jgi:DNA-binding transcriptional LysR family regulator